MGFKPYLKDQLASLSALTLLVWSYVGLPPIPDFPDVPDLRHAVPRPGKTSPGTSDVPDFKVQSK